MSYEFITMLDKISASMKLTLLKSIQIRFHIFKDNHYSIYKISAVIDPK